MRASWRTSANCEASLTATERTIRPKRMEGRRNKPQKRRLKLIRANDGKGGLDGCDGDRFAGLQEAEQVLVVDGFLAVGESDEAGVDFVELVAVERVAEFLETVG